MPILGRLLEELLIVLKRNFELNGQTYHLPINNGPNSLHGGIKGFSYQVFDYQVLDETSVEFYYVSKDGEEGYPGELDFKSNLLT